MGAEAAATIELVLHPTAVVTLPGLSALGAAEPLAIAWHDTAEGALAADGLVLAEQGGHWTLEHLRGPAALVPPPILRRAERWELLHDAVPAATARFATLEGTRQSFLWRGVGGEAAVTLVRGHAGPVPLCRVVAAGAAPVLAALAASLATALAEGATVRVPRASLAAEAAAIATGHAAAPRALGAPAVAPGQDVGDALALVLGHLADVMLHWADLVPGATGPEPVHQMRVATRRLRSALTVFRRAAPCPALDALAGPMKACAARLGEARDWDVFLRGAAAELADAFPGEPRCTKLLRAAARAHLAAYGRLRAYLAGPEFRTLSVALACAAALRPWEGEAAPLRDSAVVFGAEALTRRMRHVRQAGRGIDALPVPALHELRKNCKRLRYAAEIFAPLFPPRPTRRFVRRLAALQEELGLLNDGAAASGMLAQLGRLERGHAAGLVRGMAAGQLGPARDRIAAQWRRFRAAEPFWTD